MAVKQKQQAQKTFRLPLIGSLQNRTNSGSKDPRFVNFYAESYAESSESLLTRSKKVYLIKRPGTSLTSTLTAAEGRGMFYWDGNNYTVVGAKLYKGTNLLITLATTTGHVGFTEATDSTGAVLFVHDGTNGYVITKAGAYTLLPMTLSAWATGTVYTTSSMRIPTVDNGFYYQPTVAGTSHAATEPIWPTTIGETIVDNTVTWECKGYYDPLGMPLNALPYPVYMDGMVFLIAERTDGTNSSSIFNSDIDNPLSWGSTNFVDAEIYPDDLVVLARQNNMIVALGANSGEFLYNAELEVGSPLIRNESLTLQVGCCAANTVAQQERFCVFVGVSEVGGRAVWLLDGFAPKKISDEYIERIIDAETTSISSATGYLLRTNGHFFYVLNLTSQGRTLVYDLEEELWHEWSSNSSSTHAIFNGIYASAPTNGKSLILGRTDGKVYTLDPGVYQDNSVAILAEAITTKYDFETMNRKFMSNLNIVGDLLSGESVTVRWTDDDYATWSNWKTLSLTSLPGFNRLGAFRRRAFDILYTGNFAYRMEAIEVDVTLGTH